MKPRHSAFALFAVLTALILGAKDRIAWEWAETDDEDKAIWIVAGIVLGTCLLAWALYPYVKQLM